MKTITVGSLVITCPDDPSEAASEALAAPRMISVGAFFDRFSIHKWPILSSQDGMVKALVADCNARVKNGINLDASDVRQGLLLLVSKGFAVDPDAIIGAPVRPNERP